MTSGVDAAERFARFRLIEWWDQRLLEQARVVVVGAGALGNELVKNCALLGIGHLAVVDFDRVELSNLSRAVLFRASDAGGTKAQVAVRAARELNPGVRAVGLEADVVHGLGLGLIAWADLVLGGVDNREARLAINRACYRVGTPFIDGAIEALSGLARVFLPPEGACYECTMSADDWKALEQRHSCSLLNRELIEFGKVPTTPTTASVIAGIQCQEALKILHGRESLSGEGFVFDGVGHSSYRTTYPRNPACLSHDPIPEVRATARSSVTATVREALGWARDALGPAAVLELARDHLLGLDCPTCGDSQRVLRPLSSMAESDATCPRCNARRAPRLFHSVQGDEDFLDLRLADIGLPPWDIVLGRAGERAVGFELSADRESVLGPAMPSADLPRDAGGARAELARGSP